MNTEELRTAMAAYAAWYEKTEGQASLEDAHLAGFAAGVADEGGRRDGVLRLVVVHVPADRLQKLLRVPGLGDALRAAVRNAAKPAAEDPAEGIDS